jgi:hypothetical protein
MRKIYLKIFLFIAVVLVSSGFMSGQSNDDKAGIFPIAIKMQAYSPLSNLVRPFKHRSYDPPFSPRFYVVEVEKCFLGGHGVQLSFGARSLNKGRSRPGGYDLAKGIKARISYQKYLQHHTKRPFEGWFMTSGIQLVSANYTYSDGVDQGGAYEAHSIALDVGIGWSALIKNRLLIQASAGPQFGRQRDNYVRDPVSGLYWGDQVTPFDYSGSRFASSFDSGWTTFWGFSAYLNFSVGWVFGK